MRTKPLIQMRLLTLQPQFRRWPSVGQLASLRGLLDSAFALDPFPGDYVARSERLLPLDIYENAERVTVRVEAPGLRKEDFDLSLQEDTLTISGERRSSNDGEEKKDVRERFSRVVTLPATVNPDAVAAAYEDGVLTLTLPKAEQARPRRIEVNVR